MPASLSACRSLAIAGILLLTSALPVTGAERPQRIVSLNLCTDELLLHLADRDDILSLTYLIEDPENSTLSEQARGIRVNHGLLEEILPLEPDLVLAGKYTTRFTVNMLRRLGYRVVEFDVPASLDDVFGQIAMAAGVVGRQQRGADLIAAMRQELARATAAPSALGAVVYSPNGFTAGRDSLVDSIIHAAGLRNLVAERDLDNYGRLPMEWLIYHRPDIIILNRDDEMAPSLAQAMLSHPALARIFTPENTAVLPAKLWSCAGPANVAAVTLLRNAASRSRQSVAGTQP